MNKYFIWFKLDGDVSPAQKANESSRIHSLIFNNGGIKLKAKSNAFILGSDVNANDITNEITKISKDIQLFVIRINGTDYQGWLKEEQWKFIDK